MTVVNYTFDIPDNILSTLVASIRFALGNDAVGLTDREAGKLYLKRSLEDAYRRYKLQTEVAVLTQAAQQALDDARVAEEAARQALDTTKATVLANIKTDFNNIT